MAANNEVDEAMEDIVSIIKKAAGLILATAILGAISDVAGNIGKQLYTTASLTVVKIVAEAVLEGKESVKELVSNSKILEEIIREITGLSVEEIVEIACSEDKESEIVVHRI